MEIFMKEDDLIVSKTDLKGHITYGNEHFIKISNYSEEELLGAPHNILRHEDMPKAVFELLWERIQNKKHINAFVKNKTKNGDFYWVFANVTGSVDTNGNLIGYYSVRRKPSQKGVEVMSRIYQEMIQKERADGVTGSMNLLNKKLTEEGVEYDEFVINLQK